MKRFRIPLLFGMIVVVALLLAAASGPVFAGGGNPDMARGLERAMQVQEKHTERLLGVDGVVGTAVGLGANGNPAVLVLAEMVGLGGIPAAIDGVPVEVMVTGKIEALKKPSSEPAVDTTSRFARPVPIGVSTGHPDITAGTIGARVVKGGSVYALSNNHVYADENQADIGDAVIQPGTYDGGTSPADDIGTLAAFVSIDFSGGDNIIDAAIALSSVDDLSNATPSDGYGIPKSETVAAYVGQKVMKYGRTTGLTKGSVLAINAIVNVAYDQGVARFVGQIIVSPGTFSAGGDSGSLVVVDDRRGKKEGEDHRKPIGLLFAGSTTITIVNPIDAVLTALGVTIDGEPPQ